MFLTCKLLFAYDLKVILILCLWIFAQRPLTFYAKIFFHYIYIIHVNR